MRTFPFVAALATFISSTTFAAVLVFDNAEVFNAGLLDSSLANYGQTFDSYSGPAVSLREELAIMLGKHPLPLAFLLKLALFKL